MATISPQEMLRRTQAMAASIEEANKKEVAVGITADSASSAVYGNGINVLQVGAIHEFGAGVPKRSFLETPFIIKEDEIKDAIDKQFTKVLEGKASVDDALGRVGLVAVNISKGAFTSKGYGTWPDIKPETKAAKGSSQVLIDQGILRRAVVHEVRNK